MDIKEKSYYFLARPGFMLREIAGENTLIPINTENIQLNDEKKLPAFNGLIQLNELALLLWNSIQTPKTLSELVDIVRANYNISAIEEDIVENDIIDFLNKGIYNQIIFLTERR